MNKRSSSRSLLHFVIINDGKGHVQVAVINVECDCVTQALTYHWGASTLAISSTVALLCLLFFFFEEMIPGKRRSLQISWRGTDQTARDADRNTNKARSDSARRVYSTNGLNGSLHCSEWMLCSLRGTTSERNATDLGVLVGVFKLRFGVAGQLPADQQTANLF